MIRCCLKVFKTINGSSLFQEILFTPFSPTIKAATRLCLCDLCKVEYSLCPLFQENELFIQFLKETSLPSRRFERNSNEIEQTNTEFLLLVSIDTVWFILIGKEVDAAKEEVWRLWAHICTG